MPEIISRSLLEHYQQHEKTRYNAIKSLIDAGEIVVEGTETNAGAGGIRDR